MALNEDDKAWLAQSLGQLSADLKADTARQIETLETKLLTAFHKWAPTMEARQRGIIFKNLDLESRLTLIEDRIAEVERKQTPPPAAPPAAA